MNKKQTKIGVVGQGFVGCAVSRAFSDKKFNVATYDKFKANQTTCDIKELTQTCDVIFVCVPTPTNVNTGRCDTSIVESVITEINEYVSSCNYKTKCHTIVIKSTIPPGTTDIFATKIKNNVTLIFNPEFLNARSAYDDFINQNHIILGVANKHKLSNKSIIDIYEHLLPSAEIIITSALEAETVKYIRNSFFATKVSFFNEMLQMCDALNLTYNDVIDIVRKDDRIGFEHTRVPGPSLDENGKISKGFGGMCLPKDLLEFIHLAKFLGVDPKVMQAAWNKNIEVRPSKDWEKYPGAFVNTDD